MWIVAGHFFILYTIMLWNIHHETMYYTYEYHENRFLEYFRIRVTRKFHNTSKKIWIHFCLIFLNAAQNEDEVLLSKESRVVICCSSFLVSLHVANLIVFIGCSYSEVGWLFVFAYRTIKPCANAGKDTAIQHTHHIVNMTQTSCWLGIYNKLKI